MVILALIPIPKCSAPYLEKDLLKYTVIAQYIPRLLRIYPLFKEVTSTSGILTETAWAGAAYNLFLYMLGSHVSWFSYIFKEPHLVPSYHAKSWQTNQVYVMWHTRLLELSGICFQWNQRCGAGAGSWRILHTLMIPTWAVDKAIPLFYRFSIALLLALTLILMTLKTQQFTILGYL